MEWVKEQMRHVLGDFTTMNPKQLLLQGINLCLIVTSALMIWKSLILVTGSESPVVVVLSGSMEPGFYRGDILFLNMGKKPVRVGEVVVFNLDGRDIPIVHRVIKVQVAADLRNFTTFRQRGSYLNWPVYERSEGGKKIDILTKGDNNWGDDRALYNKGQLWLHREHIMGRVVGFLPYIGQATIIMNDYPYVKYGLIGVLAIFVLTSKE